MMSENWYFPRYVASRLGLACLASSLAPDEGLTVFAELTKVILLS